SAGTSRAPAGPHSEVAPGFPGFWPPPCSPGRPGSHLPQWPPYQPSPTRCPTFHSVTPSPIASTRPTTSCPGTRGYVIGNRPSLVSTSLWQIPHACTRTRTSLAFGSGTSRVPSSIGPPLRTTCAYRPVTFAIAPSPSNDGRTSPRRTPTSRTSQVRTRFHEISGSTPRLDLAVAGGDTGTGASSLRIA